MDRIDAAKAEESLTILAGRGLQVAQDAHRLRSKVRARPWIDKQDVEKEVARIRREVDAWEGDVRIWRRYLRWRPRWWPW